jgi:hypothetical protein
VKTVQHSRRFKNERDDGEMPEIEEKKKGEGRL